VGSCTDFVAAVANPIKIQYKDAFKFTPFSCLVDPQRVQELLLSKAQSGFPEEVAYLFQKQLEEADIIVLNKTDFLSKADKQRLVAALQDRFQDKMVMAVSAKKGDGMKAWLDFLLAGRPGAGSVLRQIDYNRYAAAEAVLGWLNSAVKLTAEPSFEASAYLTSMVYQLQDMFKRQHAAVGHLKFVMTNAGKSMWANLTSLHTEPSVSDKPLGHLAKASLIINARIRMEPAVLESVVRQALDQVSAELGVHAAIIDLQCFRPAYPDPPYVIREDPQASY
jgi:hypothetical protein